MTDIYVIGAGGHGGTVAENAVLNGYTIAGFIDDDPARIGQRFLDWEIIGGRDRIPDVAHIALGIGTNTLRVQAYQEAVTRGWHIPVLVHPRAYYSGSATLGPGTVLAPNATVHTNCRLGPACLVSANADCDHDCTMGMGAHLSAGVCLGGRTTIGERTLLGLCTCTRPLITIGTACLVGVGSVVVTDLPDYVLAYGNPARVYGEHPHV